MTKMPWGNISAGILPFDKEKCQVLLQHRSPVVNKGRNWSIIGGAVEYHDLESPITWKRVLHAYRSPPNFLPIEYAEKKKELKKYIDYSMRQELCEEGGYGCVGMNEKVTHLKPFYVFEMRDKSNGKVKFQYHNMTGFVDRQFTTPMTWESVDSVWVDVDDLIDVANGKKKLDDVIPSNRCKFNLIFDSTKEDIRRDIRKVVRNECKRLGDACTAQYRRKRTKELKSKIQKAANGYYIRYDDPECSLHRDFLGGLKRKESQQILREMKKMCLRGNK